jgi:hypothetical protein
MVEADGSQIRPHLPVSHPKWLDPATEERLQEVSPGQAPMSQLL